MITIKASDVAKMIDEGTERKAIADHYGIPQYQLNKLIQSHPDLKGRKRKKQFDFQFIDDLNVLDVQDAPSGNGAKTLGTAHTGRDLANRDLNEEMDLDKPFSNKDFRPASIPSRLG